MQFKIRIISHVSSFLILQKKILIFAYFFKYILLPYVAYLKIE